VSLLAHVVVALGIPTQTVVSRMASLSLLSPLPTLPIKVRGKERAISPTEGTNPNPNPNPYPNPKSDQLVSLSVWSQLSETFHSDLSCLLHEDPEQNFFENINHMQLHRRVRAFSKLRAMLIESAKIINPTKMITSDSNLDSDTTVLALGGGLESNNGSNEQSPSVCPLGLASLTHVVLPLALHPLTSEEFKKKDHLTLLQESAAFVGSIGVS
jgi:hypothetical protein